MHPGGGWGAVGEGAGICFGALLGQCRAGHRVRTGRYSAVVCVSVGGHSMEVWDSGSARALPALAVVWRRPGRREWLSWQVLFARLGGRASSDVLVVGRAVGKGTKDPSSQKSELRSLADWGATTGWMMRWLTSLA